MRVGVAVLPLVTGLILTSCTKQIGPEQDPEVAALPAMRANSVIEVETPIGGLQRGPTQLAVTDYPADAGLLAGPHFSLRLEWHATGPALTREDLILLGALALDATRAADGQELLLLSVDEQIRDGQWVPDDGEEATAELVVDGTATTLELLPLESDGGAFSAPKLDSVAVLASVPAGSRVELRVTDADRAQTLDVRTGERGDDEIAGYYRTTSNEVTLSKQVSAGVTIPVGIGNYPVPLEATFAGETGSADPPFALLAPYRPSGGWAKTGRAWLVVPRPVVTTPIAPGAPLYHLKVDDPTVFALQLPDGTRLTALPGGETMYISVADISPNLGRGDVSFDVPANFDQGTFVMSLGATGITASARDGEWTGTWSPAPPPVESTINLR